MTTFPHGCDRPVVDRALEIAAERRPALVASLMARFRDLELAEDAVQASFEEALGRWPQRGVPRRPVAWLNAVAQRRAIDQLRRSARWKNKAEALAREIEAESATREGLRQNVLEQQDFGDDVLRLLFTCCHPAIARQAQVALMLQVVCGLRTDEIARAFLLNKKTLEQRLVRAKRKIRDAGVPFRVPDPGILPQRLEQVLLSVYLIFNEGHTASSGSQLSRADLCHEAMRLGSMLVDLMPEEPEAAGLLALMQLVDARRPARIDGRGELVELSRQNRSKWDQQRIRTACTRLVAALARGRTGPFQVQAAIQAVHAEAREWEATDWGQIVGLYDVLETLQPTPVVRLNRAVALHHSGATEDALALLEEPELRSALDAYAPFHAAIAACYEQLGSAASAKRAWRRAAELSANRVEQQWLERRGGGGES